MADITCRYISVMVNDHHLQLVCMQGLSECQHVINASFVY